MNIQFYILRPQSSKKEWKLTMIMLDVWHQRRKRIKMLCNIIELILNLSGRSGWDSSFVLVPRDSLCIASTFRNDHGDCLHSDILFNAGQTIPLSLMFLNIGDFFLSSFLDLPTYFPASDTQQGLKPKDLN